MKKLKIFFSVIIALMLCGNVFAQTKVTGKVLDNTGQGFPGVTVVVKGTTTGTVTDLDGQYSLNVEDSETSVLSFSFIGYESQEVAINNRTTIDVTLKENVEELEEVVVIGYGTTKKSDLTAAISSVSAEELTAKPVSNVEQALQGRATGVHVNQSSGRPGDGPNITIRGIGSIKSDTKPLWIIDGVMVTANSAGKTESETSDPLFSLSPDDIERIEILKDAASTAIYGSRGSNGVILVTTKSGKAGKSQTNVSYSYQMREQSKKIDLLNARELMTLQNLARTNEGLKPLFSEEAISTITIPGGYVGNDTDWQDEIGQPGVAHNLSVSTSGGTEATRFFLSGNYQDETGIIKSTGLKKATLRLNIDHKLNDKISIGANMSAYTADLSKTNIEGQSFSPGPVGGSLQYVPYYPVIKESGDYYVAQQPDNPVAVVNGHIDGKRYHGAQGKFSLNYKILPSLSVEVSTDGELLKRLDREFIPSSLKWVGGLTNEAKANYDHVEYFKWTSRAIVRFSKEFGIHSINVMAGYEEEEWKQITSATRSQDLLKEDWTYYQLAAFDRENNYISSSNDQAAFRSVLSRGEYKLLNRYVITGILRLDGSSKFSPDYKYGLFPSLSVAWKAHEESFIKALNVFDELKVRANYGIVGSDRISTYRWLPQLRYGDIFNGSAMFENSRVAGAAVVDIPNSEIRWERGEQYDMGVDLAFFKRRLWINLDYYNRTTSDLLVDERLPYYTGFGYNWGGGEPEITANRAKINNSGYEVGVGGVLVSTKDFNWDATFGYSHNINKVVDVPTESGTISIDGGTLREGFPLGEVRGFITDGLYQNDLETLNSPTYSTARAKPGDQRYLDANEDGRITDSDRGIIGNSNPGHLFNLSTGIRYKFFELNVLAYSALDVYRINYSNYDFLMSGSLNEFNGSKELLNAWFYNPADPNDPRNNTNTDIPRMSYNYEKLISDRFIEDASYLKIANIQFVVNMPQKVSDYLRLRSLKMYVSAQNMITITNYSGYDPEIVKQTGQGKGVWDQASYPPYKAWTFGINIGL